MLVGCISCSCLLWFQARNIALCLEFRDSDEEDALPLKVMSHTNTQFSAWSDFTTELHLFYKMTATSHMLPYDRFNIQYILPFKSLKRSVIFLKEMNTFIQQKSIKLIKSESKYFYIVRKQNKNILNKSLWIFYSSKSPEKKCTSVSRKY